jgi:hypothetical protein
MILFKIDGFIYREKRNFIYFIIYFISRWVYKNFEFYKNYIKYLVKKNLIL